jgi:polyribonucleotide nucleotidyltransferase
VPPPPPSRSCAQTRRGIHKLKQIKQPILVDELQNLRKERQNILGKKNEEKEAFKQTQNKVSTKPETCRETNKQTNKRLGQNWRSKLRIRTRTETNQNLKNFLFLGLYAE